MDNKPKLFGDMKVSKPVTVVTKKVMSMKGSRSLVVKKHPEEEEKTAKQLVKMMRVVKPKKTPDEVCKKKNNLVKSLKNKRIEPETPNATEQKENKTMKVKESKGTRGRGRMLKGCDWDG